MTVKKSNGWFPGKEMFDTVTASIEQCKGILLHTLPHHEKGKISEETVAQSIPEPVGDEAGDGTVPYSPPEPNAPLMPPCILVRVLEDMESFMGVDGRIHTLKGRYSDAS